MAIGTFFNWDLWTIGTFKQLGIGMFGQLGPSAIETFGQLEIVGSSYIKKMHKIKIKSVTFLETCRVIENIKLTINFSSIHLHHLENITSYTRNF